MDYYSVDEKGSFFSVKKKGGGSSDHKVFISPSHPRARLSKCRRTRPGVLFSLSLSLSSLITDFFPRLFFSLCAFLCSSRSLSSFQLVLWEHLEGKGGEEKKNEREFFSCRLGRHRRFFMRRSSRYLTERRRTREGTACLSTNHTDRIRENCTSLQVDCVCAGIAVCMCIYCLPASIFFWHFLSSSPGSSSVTNRCGKISRFQSRFLLSKRWRRRKKQLSSFVRDRFVLVFSLLSLVDGPWRPFRYIPSQIWNSSLQGHVKTQKSHVTHI